MAELLNTARIDGLYDGETTVWMETTLAIEMVSISVQKTANHEVWGGGDLTYTVTITNSEALPITNLTLTDTLEYEKVIFTEESVALNGVPLDPSLYQYDPETGILTVSVGDIEAEGTAMITFRVTKA